MIHAGTGEKEMDGAESSYACPEGGRALIVVTNGDGPDMKPQRLGMTCGTEATLSHLDRPKSGVPHAETIEEGILEDSMGRAFSLHGGIVQTTEEVNVQEDVLDPVLQELSGEITGSSGIIHNGLDSLPTEELRLMADRFWLKAVFRNLLRNAIKYGGKGVKIAIGLRDLGTHIQLNVYNSGLPVPEEKRAHLFSRFGRLSSGKDTNMNGIGLGLYLVHEVIRKCGGHIRYEAKKHGSNFVFTLPKGWPYPPGCDNLAREFRQP